MARLSEGEIESRLEQVLRLLRRSAWGITEAEIAQELGWGRRAVNNYLRRLAQENKAYREGKLWFAERPEK